MADFNNTDYIIVTGASSGIGKALALKLNEAGDLLDFLAKYGFVEYTQGRYAFHMHFDKEVRREALRSDIENKLQDVRDDLVEYKRLLGKDETEDYSTQEQELTKQTEELVKTT